MAGHFDLYRQSEMMEEFEKSFIDKHRNECRQILTKVEKKKEKRSQSQKRNVCKSNELKK